MPLAAQHLARSSHSSNFAERIDWCLCAPLNRSRSCGRLRGDVRRTQPACFLYMPDKHAVLTRLLGRLRIQEQREQFSRLEEFLSSALLPDDLQQVKKSRFSFEAAEMVAPENIAAEL